jgi:hypothetical protein
MSIGSDASFCFTTNGIRARGGSQSHRVSHSSCARQPGCGFDSESSLERLTVLYKQVLKQEIGWLEGVERAKRSARLPVVLTRDEVHKIFAHLHGTPRLMAGLLYGSGLGESKGVSQGSVNNF